ncbi:MAG: hypothetical protein CMJ62_10600 [Planctomycetaceae bacterium]|nr:hypothetical protein [Planctomycetaceae bacterium]
MVARRGGQGALGLVVPLAAARPPYFLQGDTVIGYVRYSPRVKVARRKTDKGTEGDSPVNSVENQKDQVQRWLKGHGLDPLGVDCG